MKAGGLQEEEEEGKEGRRVSYFWITQAARFSSHAQCQVFIHLQTFCDTISICTGVFILRMDSNSYFTVLRQNINISNLCQRKGSDVSKDLG